MTAAKDCVCAELRDIIQERAKTNMPLSTLYSYAVWLHVHTAVAAAIRERER